MKRLFRITIVVCLLLLLIGCKAPAPNREFHYSDNGYSDGSVAYELLPQGWRFDSESKTCIGVIDDMRMYALDPEQRFIQPEKHWYQDVDFSIAKRSDIVLPDVMDENIEIVFYGTNMKMKSHLNLSDQACEEFRAFYQMQEDLISESMQATITNETKPIATIWFLYPQIEGLRYSVQTSLYYYKSKLYMFDPIQHTSAEIPLDTILYREITDWLLS